MWLWGGPLPAGRADLAGHGVLLPQYPLALPAELRVLPRRPGGGLRVVRSQACPTDLGFKLLNTSQWFFPSLSISHSFRFSGPALACFKAVSRPPGRLSSS